VTVLTTAPQDRRDVFVKVISLALFSTGRSRIVKHHDGRQLTEYRPEVS
jgi:hypothetical protein